MKAPNSYLACKIGGSVLTDKSRLKTPNQPAMAAYARQILALDAEARGRLVMIAGGGSFGSALAHPDYAASEPDHVAAAVANFDEWARLLEDSWIAEGLDCVVLTADRQFRREGASLVFDAEQVLNLLAGGTTPVLMGGMLQRKGGVRIFSSDVIPLLIARAMPLGRFASLTNVPGVLVDGAPLRRIDAMDRSLARAATQGSAVPDATGGMRLKLHAALRLSGMGVESVICSGLDPSLFARALLASPPPGTWIPSSHELRAAAC